MHQKIVFNKVLETIFSTKTTKDKDGNTRNVDDMISRDEAFALYKMFQKANTGTSIEIGLAHGVSALVFCQAHHDSGNTNGIHYGVDPNQFISYNGAAVQAVTEAGYSMYLKVLAGPSHLEVPELIKQNIKVDCAFIDGWHTFDYTLVDFFLIDKLLKPGGYLAFHDMYAPSKQKVLQFILTHRKYRVAKEFMVHEKNKILVLKFFIWRLFKYPSLFFSWFHWIYQTRGTSGLIVLEKIENYEPPFDFYKSF